MELSPQARSYVAMTEQICAEICDEQDYKVLCVEGDATVLIEILADSKSAGFLIGRGGKMALALREILGAMGRHQKRVVCRVETVR